MDTFMRNLANEPDEEGFWKKMKRKESAPW